MAKQDSSDIRRRQDKRDESIRKRLDQELGRRKKQVGNHKTSKKQYKGTVMALKPLAPLTMRHSTTVLDAAKYMAAKSANCVLVLDDEGDVCGIFTAKDMAYKVVAAQKDVRRTTVSEIMTGSPTCTDVNTSAIDALNLMVNRGFRHLPVVDDDGEIAGVLDITKCFYEAMHKLERAYESSRKLHDALEGVQSELGNEQPAQVMQYVRALKERTSGPDLGSVLDGQPPVFVDAGTSVLEAAIKMKASRTTAVLVTDENTITGIFTSKDIVLRVLAAGLEPAKVSVIRVNTPKPDSAPVNMSIQEALRKMHDGHYLNLPVMDPNGEVLGVVDVLKLTYATLEQINSMSTSESTQSGPAWNKFWMSLDDDSESVHSEQQQTDISASELAQFSNAPEEGSDMFCTNDEIRPEDSLSRMGIREETTRATFKFRAPSGRVHRVNVDVSAGIAAFRQAVSAKLSAKEIQDLGGEGKIVDDHWNGGFCVSYVDGDGDAVVISSSHDIEDAVKLTSIRKNDRVEVFVHHPSENVEVSQLNWIPYAVAAIGAGALVAFLMRRK